MAEVAGSNPAGTTDLLPWPSGDGTSLTWRGSQVRVLPGVLPCPARTCVCSTNLALPGCRSRADAPSHPGLEDHDLVIRVGGRKLVLLDQPGVVLQRRLQVGRVLEDDPQAARRLDERALNGGQ